MRPSHLPVLALLCTPLAMPARAQAVHPRDTVFIGRQMVGIMPRDTGRFQLVLQRRSGSTPLWRAMLRSAPAPRSEPVAAAAPAAAAPAAPPPPAGEGNRQGSALYSESFESGWGLFDNGGGGAPTGVSRDNARAREGSSAARRSFGPNAGDAGSGFALPFYYKGPARTMDRMTVAFDFYFDALPGSAFKFVLFWSEGFSDDFGGLYVHDGRWLTWSFLNEWSGSAARLADISGMTNGWHHVTMDYWRNGDPSGNPSVAVTLDGRALSAINVPAPGHMAGGRLNAGARSGAYRTKPLGALKFLATINGGNRATGTVWIDNVTLAQ